RVLDESGSLVVEISDDHVVSEIATDAANVKQWREIEVELGSGDEQLLATIGEQLLSAGARPAPSGDTKLGRAFGDRGPATPTENPIRDYVARQRAAILAGDLAFRSGNYDVHDTRVATRRLRSMLRSYRQLFEPDSAAHL